MSSRIIFDIHIDIPKDKLDTDLGSYDWDDIPRAERTKIEFNKYHERLRKNKEEYAEKIGVDYKHYTRDHEYLSFLAFIQGTHPHLSEYLVVNFYKLHLMEKLSEEYDEVLYVDFDVYFNTDKNYFDQFDTSTGIYLAAHDQSENAQEFLDMRPDDKMYLRSELNKWFIAYAMCMEDFIEYTYPVTNTGLILANRYWISKLAFMDHVHDMVRLIDKMKADEDSMFSDNIRSTLDWNNEPFYSYVAQMNEVPLVDNSGPWNFIANYRMTKEEYDSSHKEVVHMILKRFDWIWP